MKTRVQLAAARKGRRWSSNRRRRCGNVEIARLGFGRDFQALDSDPHLRVEISQRSQPQPQPVVALVERLPSLTSMYPPLQSAPMRMSTNT